MPPSGPQVSIHLKAVFAGAGALVYLARCWREPWARRRAARHRRLATPAEPALEFQNQVVLE